MLEQLMFRVKGSISTNKQTFFARLMCVVLKYQCVFPPNQLRNTMNQEQNSKLQQQRENLNKKNQEVANMDKRVNELRDRLWKKKAALQQKENLPVSAHMITVLSGPFTAYRILKKKPCLVTYILLHRALD